MYFYFPSIAFFNPFFKEIGENSRDLHQILNTADLPLNQLNADVLCPGNQNLQMINAGFR
ncbi:MAG: hypothetical protein LBE36_00620 [Flavobacteriaceae bacterium]|jgi:hypothetical protein|nr:hypothetical protein [Flavobacteriaceae bacterium]